MDKVEQTDEPVIEEFYEQLVRRWPLRLAAVLVSVLIGIGVVFGARSIYRHANNTSVSTQPVKPSHSIASPSSGPAKSSQPSSKPSTGNQAATNPSLPNSGPGQVFEIFAVTSLGAAALHFIISNKRTGTRLT